jgi:hypothetical protein
MLGKPLLLSVAFLVAAATTANADLQYRPSIDPWLSAEPSSRMVPKGRAPHPASWYYDPYAGGAGPCPQTHRHGRPIKCKDLIPRSSW